MNDRAGLLASVDARGFRAYLRETGNTICGRNGLATMLELLPRVAPHARAVPLAHYASGDLPGMQEDSSVSYVAMAFLREAPPGASFGPPLVALPQIEDAPPETPSLAPDEGQRLVRLARARSRPTSSSGTTSAASSRRGRREPSGKGARASS
jgi:hypothetical protein